MMEISFNENYHKYNIYMCIYTYTSFSLSCASRFTVNDMNVQLLSVNGLLNGVGTLFFINTDAHSSMWTKGRHSKASYYAK